LRFAFEAAASGHIGCIRSANEFNGDFTAELFVFANVNVAHAAGTEVAQNPVVRDLGTF